MLAVVSWGLLFSTTLQSCSSESLGFEGEWVMIDSLHKGYINQTTLKLSKSNFDLKQSQKLDDANEYVDIITQKGTMGVFAESMSCKLLQYQYLSSGELKESVSRDEDFKQKIDTLVKVTTKYKLPLIYKDTVVVYKFEVYDNKLHLKYSGGTYTFSRK